jgi:DNA (cytosine-5)-methyltransferase 1
MSKPTVISPFSGGLSLDLDLDDRMEKPSVIELFAGAGGLALGLEQAGLAPVVLIDNDRWACETLKLNRPNWNVICNDVSKMDWKAHKADVVVGGFPCQAFSHAGKKLGFEDTRGTLFFEFARCVNEVRPKIFVGENVAGLAIHDNGRTLKTMLSVLKSFGYNVQYKVLDAVNYGVPQKRKRIFIVGTLPNISFSFPEPSRKVVTLRDALKDVPKSPGARYPEKRRVVLELVPPGGCWVDLPLELQRKYMGKSFYSGGGRRGMARRLSWDEASLTLTTSPAQKETERCHPEETRPLAIRECARIQTFPDNWQFAGGVGAQYRQIGNAVPVKLAKAIGLGIIAALKGGGNRKQVTFLNYQP